MDELEVGVVQQGLEIGPREPARRPRQGVKVDGRRDGHLASVRLQDLRVARKALGLGWDG